LRSHRSVDIVQLKEILYLQVDNGCTTVFLTGGKKVVTTKTLKDYEELLPGTSFLRTHQSYMVNELYIDRYHPKQGILHLKDGKQIPVSFRKRELVDKYFKTL
jgi:two-component system LytT family response regulator